MTIMTGGACCSVATCKSNSRKSKREGQHIRFFSFPNDSLTRKAWVKRCKRTNKFVPKGKNICSLHFKISDYEDGIKAQLMNFPPMKLKKDAVPSLNLPGSASPLKHASEREKRYTVKLRKQIVKECLEQYKVKVSDRSKRKEAAAVIEEKNRTIDKNVNLETVPIQQFNKELVTRSFNKDCGCGASQNCLKCQLQTLQEENEYLKGRIEVHKQNEIDFKRNEKNFRHTINKLQKRFNRRDVTFESKAKLAFDHFLSPNQVDILLKKKTKVRWTEDEFTKAFNILQFSKRFYVYLKDTLNYPLPGFSTLKKWIADISLKIEKDCHVEDVSDHALDYKNLPLNNSLYCDNQPSNHSLHSENQPNHSLHSENQPNHYLHSENQPSIHPLPFENRPSNQGELYQNLTTNYPIHSNNIVNSEFQSLGQALRSENIPSNLSRHSDNQSLNHHIHSEISPSDKSIHSYNQPLNHFLHAENQPPNQPIHSENQHFNQPMHSDNLPFNHIVQTKNCPLDQPIQSDNSIAPEHLPLEEGNSNESLNLGDQQIKMFCSKVYFPSGHAIDSENTTSKDNPPKRNLNPKEKRSSIVPNKSFQFHLSHKNFFNKLILNRLRRKASKPTKPKRFICSTCNKGFDLNGALKRHFKTHLLENPWTCDVCDEIFSSKFYLDRHITTHKNADRFQCDICDQSFVKKINFKDHYLKHKNIQPQDTCNKKLDTDRCINESTSGKQCSKGKLPITTNCPTQAKLKPYLCHICNNLFEVKNDLKVHLEICKAERKNSIKNAKEEKVIYVCESCNKEFKNRQYFQSHLLKHANQNMFRCEICDKTFSAQHCLKRHMLLHDSNENKVQFLCNVCNKAFSQKRYLSQHMQTHLNEKPYSCELCPKRFAQNSTLKKHIEAHKNENYSNQNYLPEGAMYQ